MADTFRSDHDYEMGGTAALFDLSHVQVVISNVGEDVREDEYRWLERETPSRGGVARC